MKTAFDEIMATAVKRQHESQRIVGVTGSTDHRDVVMQPEQVFEAIEHDRMIVDECDANRHRSGRFRKLDVERRAGGPRLDRERSVQ